MTNNYCPVSPKVSFEALQSASKVCSFFGAFLDYNNLNANKAHYIFFPEFMLL